MEFFLILFIIVLILDILALRWGFDSTDCIDSLEWQRRKNWNPFH